MKLCEHLGAYQLLRVNSVVTLCYQSSVRAFDWLWLMQQNFREALLLMCWLTSSYSSESIIVAENPSSWLLLLQNAMEMRSQLYIILTLVESQMPHSSPLRYRSRFVWQSIRNNLTVEWGRPDVCKSDLIHRNLGTFSQASPLFRAQSNANFHMLLPVKVQSVETVSCGVKQLSAVIADLSSWDWDQNIQTPTFAIVGSSARS